MDLGLNNKAVLVTAASQGVGRAIAEEFLKERSRVAICARHEEGLSRCAEELSSHGKALLTIRADVTRVDDVERVVAQTMQTFGGIDVLVNNAGEAWMGHSLATSDAQWQYCIEVNLYSAIRFTRCVAPYMQRQGGGRIVNISSVSGHTMTGGMVDYQTAKAAMIAFSKSMSIDLAPYNILVNCVCPALIHTPLWDRLADSMVPAFGKSRDEVFRTLASQLLEIKRFGRPEEVAAVVVFLASARASFITGTAYDVDGGITKSMF